MKSEQRKKAIFQKYQKTPCVNHDAIEISNNTLLAVLGNCSDGTSIKSIKKKQFQLRVLYARALNSGVKFGNKKKFHTHKKVLFSIKPQKFLPERIRCSNGKLRDAKRNEQPKGKYMWANMILNGNNIRGEEKNKNPKDWKLHGKQHFTQVRK